MNIECKEITKATATKANKVTKNTGALVLAALALTCTLQANAGEFTVGVGAAATNSEYVSDKSNKIQYGVVPFISYEGERFSIGLGEVSYDVFKKSGLDVSAIASTRSVEFDTTAGNLGSLDTDDKRLAGMEKRKIAVEAGMRVSYMDLINLSVLHDVTKAHKGYAVDANAMLPLPVGKFIIMPAAGVSFESKNLVNYQYGVSEKESRADRPAYSPKSTLNPYLGLTTIYPVSNKMNFIFSGQYKFLGDAIKDSPIVDKDHTLGGFTGLMYTF